MEEGQYRECTWSNVKADGRMSLPGATLDTKLEVVGYNIVASRPGPGGPGFVDLAGALRMSSATWRSNGSTSGSR